MWVKNPSKVEAKLARGHVNDEMAVAALVVPQAYRITKKGLVPLGEPPPAAPHDPPDTSLYTVWSGVSVTVAGHVTGPSKPPFARLAVLRVGEAERAMAVFGDRVWEKSLFGGLAPSEPQPFDELELSLGRAFGGGYDVPPGLMPSEDRSEELPHPGFRCDHPLNPKGVGLYADECSASGAALPNFERRGALLERWDDSPEPVAFSPCRELVGWRTKGRAEQYEQARLASDSATISKLLKPAFRVFHHAPPELIFDDVLAGTLVEVEGLSSGPLRFAVPGCLVRFDVQPSSKGGAVVHVPPRLRSLHVDADRGLLLTAYALSFRYHPKRVPRGACVTRLPEALR